MTARARHRHGPPAPPSEGHRPPPRSVAAPPAGRRCARSRRCSADRGGSYITGPECPDDLDGLLEPLGADLVFRPALSGHVLVEALAGPDAEHEASGHHARRGRCGLRDDRRVDALGRARDPGAEADALGGGRDATDDRPHERAVALSVDPWVIVVRDAHVVEAGRLRRTRIGDEGRGIMLLARERVADVCCRHADLLVVERRLRVCTSMSARASRPSAARGRRPLQRYRAAREDRDHRPRHGRACAGAGWTPDHSGQRLVPDAWRSQRLLVRRLSGDLSTRAIRGTGRAKYDVNSPLRSPPPNGCQPWRRHGRAPSKAG